jgi:hypothetical protein
MRGVGETPKVRLLSPLRVERSWGRRARSPPCCAPGCAHLEKDPLGSEDRAGLTERYLLLGVLLGAARAFFRMSELEQWRQEAIVWVTMPIP